MLRSPHSAAYRAGHRTGTATSMIELSTTEGAESTRDVPLVRPQQGLRIRPRNVPPASPSERLAARAEAMALRGDLTPVRKHCSDTMDAAHTTHTHSSNTVITLRTLF
jgi:hypothetical protein